MNGDDLGSKFSYAPVWGRGCWGVKNVKFAPFSANWWKIKSCITSKNQPLKSIRREDMGFPLLFDLKKVLFYLEIRYVHVVGALDMPFEGGGRSRLISAILTPLSPKEVVFWSGFRTFCVCSSHNSPSNWSWGAKIEYLHLVWALDVPFKGLENQA